jgi:hypothetical protein
VDIVILAGAKTPPELRELTGVEDRALLPVGGRTMLDIVTQALRPHGDLVVVGPHCDGAMRRVEAGGSYMESLRQGLGAVRTETFLLTMCDLPHLTSEGVGDFLSRCDPGALLNYPVLDAQATARAYPGVRRTTLRLREGEFTGGNLGLLRADLMREALPLLERAYALRKSPIGLGGLVGWGLVVRLVVGRFAPRTLSLPYLERRVGRFVGGPVRAIRTPYVEIGADVDDIAQYSAMIGMRN